MVMWNCHVMKKLDHLRVFGTECYVYIPKQFRKKFDKSLFGRMIGYLNDKDGYQFYMPSVKSIVHFHDVFFKLERVCTSSVVETGFGSAAVEDVVAEKGQEDDTMSGSSQSEKTLEVETEYEFSRNTGRPVRTVKQPMWMTSGDYILLSARTAITGGGGDPTSYWETMNSAQQEWVKAMKEEMGALVENDTWDLADCPKNVKVIDNRWVVQMKLNADNLAQRLRARLAVKGRVERQALFTMRPSALWHAMTQYVLCSYICYPGKVAFTPG